MSDTKKPIRLADIGQLEEELRQDLAEEEAKGKAAGENDSHEEPAICCTNCKAKISQSDFDGWVWNFCPVCGFKMEDATEEKKDD